MGIGFESDAGGFCVSDGGIAGCDAGMDAFLAMETGLGDLEGGG